MAGKPSGIQLDSLSAPPAPFSLCRLPHPSVSIDKHLPFICYLWQKLGVPVGAVFRLAAVFQALFQISRGKEFSLT